MRNVGFPYRMYFSLFNSSNSFFFPISSVLKIFPSGLEKDFPWCIAACCLRPLIAHPQSGTQFTDAFFMSKERTIQVAAYNSGE